MSSPHYRRSPSLGNQEAEPRPLSKLVKWTALPRWWTSKESRQLRQWKPGNRGVGQNTTYPPEGSATLACRPHGSFGHCSVVRSLCRHDTTAAATVVSVSGVLVSDQVTSVSEPRRSVSPSFGTGLVSFGPNSAQFYVAGAAVSFLFSLTQRYLLNRVSLS